MLARGGVIGGSSAGATIQGDLLVRGHPLGNQIMVADGYRRGLGLLEGVAVDQHFKQRNRFDDLMGVVKRFPKILGIGIDESTALVVQSPNRCQVIAKVASGLQVPKCRSGHIPNMPVGMNSSSKSSTAMDCRQSTRRLIEGRLPREAFR